VRLNSFLWKPCQNSAWRQFLVNLLKTIIMRNIKLLVYGIILILILCSYPFLDVLAQNETSFQKVFTISKTSTPIKVFQTKDNGYFISGFQTDETVGNGDGLAFKINKYGQKEWLKGYNRIGADYNINGSTQLIDSSYIVLAELDGKGVIQKISKNGILIWQKSFRIVSGSIRFINACAADNGSFFVSGEYSDGIVRSIVLKFDLNGNNIWQKRFEHYNTQNNFPNSFFLNGDTLIVDGLIPSVLPSATDTIYAMKINTSNGSVFYARKIWQDSLTVLNFSMAKRADNNFVFAVSFFNQNNSTITNSVILMNKDFGIIKSIKLLNLPDGYFISSTGFKGTNDIGIGFQDFLNNTSYLIKIDSNLRLGFSKSYTQNFKNNSTSTLTNVNSTSDSGFIVTGKRIISDSTFLYIIKTDKDGNTGSCIDNNLNIGVASTMAGESDFNWHSVIDLNAQMAIANIPETNLNSKEASICKTTTCIVSIPANNTFTGGIQIHSLLDMVLKVLL
jgi:hypothetical protein